MKINTKLILVILLSVVALNLCKSLSKSKHKNGLKHKKKCPGGGSSPSGGSMPWNNLNYPDANTFSYVNNDPYLLQNAQGFKNAKIFPGTLPTHLNSFPYTGVFKTADTGIHNKYYYDGSLHLGQVAKINCELLTTQPRACVNEKGCGWCGENNKCIGASPLGPIQPCVRSSFIYTLPSVDWNPLKAAAINIHAQDNNGRSLLKVTHEPNLNEAFVARPYRLD